MIRKIFLIILLSFFCFSCGPVNMVFAGTQAVEYLCQLGATFYSQGRYEDALSEFKKVLLLEPQNEAAQNYVNSIFQEESQPVLVKEKIQKRPTKQEVIDETLNNLDKVSKESPQAVGLKISGETQVRLGVTAEDAYWKRANWDLNEKNWRIRSSDALNRRENTYDPRIYDRVRVNLDKEAKQGLGFHANITVDPWSFTGRSEKVNLVGVDGDTLQLELKYWANTGYTINDTVNTGENGDSISLPEIKVIDGHTSTPVSKQTAFYNTFTIPEIKIYDEFQPLRELWLDYCRDDIKVRFYPFAYENQSLTFDDPLKLSNNRIWWEDSPWIRGWKPGVYNRATSTVDFTKGYWDNTWSFFARDSEGQRLTSLRGINLEYSPQEGASFVTSIATPKTPWQHYSDFDNFITASRYKQSLRDNLELGLTATTRLGYNLEDRDKLDATNYVGAADLGYEIIDGLKTTVEVAHSQAKYDLTNSDYKTQGRGWAYQVSLLGRFPLEDIMDTQNGYDGIQPAGEDKFFTKFRLFASRMDESFDEPLSSYVETRDDESWSRHLHFRQPFKYYYQGEGQLSIWDDIKNYRIGNGIDIGRSVLGLRVESLLFDKKIENLVDVRNVHEANGKFLENVSREELTAKVTDKLTTKALGIYQQMHKTRGGMDPFVFNTRNRAYYLNSYIEDGKNTNIATGSLGLEYQFFDWVALNGIWEYTNDYSLGYDNFPRGILESGNRSLMSYEYDKIYRDTLNWLTYTAHFPRPPYPYYNIFKTGLRLDLLENLEIYLDYTRNPYEKAGQVDDNMNHLGFELAYAPMKKMGVFFKYTYSRWQDLDSLTLNDNKVYGHHNLFAELIYRFSENEDFAFQYGEASRNPYMGGVLDIGWDPYGGSLRTIDTQHIFRLYYRRKF